MGENAHNVMGAFVLGRDRKSPEIAAMLQNGPEASEDLNDSVHRYHHGAATRRRLRDLALT